MNTYDLVDTFTVYIILVTGVHLKNRHLYVCIRNLHLDPKIVAVSQETKHRGFTVPVTDVPCPTLLLWKNYSCVAICHRFSNTVWSTLSYLPFLVDTFI